MNVWTVRKKIIIGFTGVIVVMVALCAFAYVQLRRIEGQAEAFRADSIPGLYLVGKLRTVSVATRMSLQQHILENDPVRMLQTMADLEATTKESLELLTQYEPTIRTAKDRQLYEEIKFKLAPYLVVQRQVARLSADPKTKAQAATVLLEQLQPLHTTLQDSIRAEVDLKKADADESSAKIQQTVATAQTGMLIGLLASLLLAVATAYFLVQAIDRPLTSLLAAMEPMRTGDFTQRLTMKQEGEFGVFSDGLSHVAGALQEMIRRVQTSGVQVNTSATEIAATAQEQFSTASQVSVTTSEIGATSEAISTTSKELVETIKEIAQVAEKTAALAGSGQTGLNRMKATMQEVMDASASINARFGALNEKAGHIGAVVTTITKVADQTNLLSLNAAIEAEKAGDYGRGFAVVAAEIRRLADQTALATGDIEQMVKEMQSAVAAGVMGMDKFSEEVRRGGEVVQHVSDELSQIIHHVQALTPDFEIVSEGMQSQSKRAQQISDALSLLSDASKQTVESLRTSNLAIEQLNDAARGLQDGVAKFTL